MDFRFDPGIETFRAEVRAFLADALAGADRHADSLDLTGLAESYERDLHRRAGARGWLALDGVRKAVFDFEAARCDAPLIDTAMTLAGHAVATYGSPAQRGDLLPRMATGEVEMCIAYTEDAAGSDLSAIAALASRDGDGWVLSGHKVLVTGAHKADWCCTVARTRFDVPARQGMTMFLIDMRTPGVEIVRRPTMNGWTLDDVGFNDVYLGPEAVLGEPGAGWAQLTAAAAAERSSMFWLGNARHVLDLLVALVRTGTRDGTPLADDPIARDTVARFAVALADAERLARRALWSDITGQDDPALPAMAKVTATELLQDLAQAATELAGPAGLIWSPLFTSDRPMHGAGDGRLAWEYLERVHGTISVGANELQRDTIAQRGLGLPRGR